MAWRLAIVGVAVALAVAPLPPALVERFYSTGAYLRVQPVLTGLSNRVPFALFDALLVVMAVGWVALAVSDRVWHRKPWTRVGVRLASRTVVLAAVVYVAFLAAWGLNYRRLPLAEKIEFDERAITPAALVAFADRAVDAVNELYPQAHAELNRRADPDTSLVDAFARVQIRFGLARAAEPGRPKVSLLNPYFRAAAVDGMTAPVAAETLLVSDLLPIERPFVVAHEWSHLAGFADEGEASFVGWLTCLEGDAVDQYSGWLFAYGQAARALAVDERRAAAGRLAPGPQGDLQAIADRRARGVRPAVSSAGWQVYDRYLKANRVERGAESYGDVLRLMLGAKNMTGPSVVSRASSS